MASCLPHTKKINRLRPRLQEFKRSHPSHPSFQFSKSFFCFSGCFVYPHNPLITIHCNHGSGARLGTAPSTENPEHIGIHHCTMTRSSARCSSGSYSHPILCLPWSEIVDKWHWMGWHDPGWILWEIRFQKQKNFWKYVNFSMEASNKPLSWPGYPNSACHLSLNLMTPACCMSNSGLGPQQKCDATVSRVDLVLCFTSMKTIPIATLPMNLLYDVLWPTLLTMNPKKYTSNPPMSDRKGAWNTVGIATPKRTAKNPYAEVGVQCCTLVAAFLISSVSFRFMTITRPSHLLNLSGQLWL